MMYLNQFNAIAEGLYQALYELAEEDISQCNEEDVLKMSKEYKERGIWLRQVIERWRKNYYETEDER